MAEENKNKRQLIYIEPNNENSYKDFDNHGIGQEVPIAPDLSDFCIAVDLEVEVKGRTVVGGTKSNEQTIIMSWNNNSSGSTVSFMQGTTIKFNKSENSGYVDSLTTSYTDIFYNDIKDKQTNEMFGISSIDIDYNNYFVPQVTIQFVDVRGVSLFAPEQLAHNNSSNGMSGVASNDVAGSFFKCFFTFPYPKFRLSVKGIYGQPVAYELTCSDFRATFDSKTGNFGAKATFIGYAFSLLNDITMNILTVAPLSDFLGREYWESKLNTTFTVTDANLQQVPMKTLTEIIDSIKNIRNDVSKIASSDPVIIKQNSLATQLDNLTEIELCYSNFINSMITNAQKRGAKITDSSLHTVFVQENKKGLIVLSNNSGDTIDTYVEASLYEPLLTAIAKYNNNNGGVLKQYIPIRPSGNVYEILTSDGGGGVKLITPKIRKDYEPAKIISKLMNEEPKLLEDFNTVLSKSNSSVNKEISNYFMGFAYVDNGLLNKVDNLKKQVTNDVTINEEEVTSVKNRTIATSLGFIPSVENITKIFMAHLETLMYMIYQTALKTGDRTLSSMGMSINDADMNSNATIVPPFPKYTKESGSNSNKIRVDNWIGNCSGNVPERDLIHGLLNGVANLQVTINKAVNEVKNTDGEGNIVLTSMKIPLTPLDMLLSSNPFGESIDFSEISDFIGRVVLRMHQVIALPCFEKSDWVSNSSLLGKADAKNFADLFPRPSDDFVRRLNMQDFTPDFMLDVTTNSPKENIQKEKKNNKWAWDGDSSKSSPLSIDGERQFLNLYKISDNNTSINKVIPIQGFTFKEIIKDLKVKNNLIGTMPNNLNNYITISDKLSIDKAITINPNIFKVDDNVEIYENYVKSITVDEDNVSKIKEHFKCVYNSEEYEYFFNMSGQIKTFAKRFKDVSFKQEIGNRILSPIKRTLNEIKDTPDVFAYGNRFLDWSYIVQDGKKISRKFGFGDVFKDLTQIGEYTIPSFAGYEQNNKRIEISDKVCLFGQYGYYLQNQASDSQLVKSLMFLDILDGISLERYINKLTNITGDGIFIAPKLSSLLCGAYLWRYDKMLNNNDREVLLQDTIFNFSAKKTDRIIGRPLNDKLFALRRDIKSYLIEQFKTWSATFFATNIQSEFELRVNGKVMTAEEIKQLTNNLQDNKFLKTNGYVNLEDYLSQTFDDNFFINYISISQSDNSDSSYSVKLFNREASDAVINSTMLYTQKATTIKGIKYLFDNQANYSLEIEKGYIKDYLKSFITELRIQYKNINTVIKQSANGAFIAADPFADDNVKIALYKYCKIIYDRWVGGTSFEDWSLEKFFKPHFYFIDAYYNKIGEIALINLEDIRDRMINSLTQNEYSLLSFMGDILANNSFQLMCVQNFADLSNTEQMKEMFKPIAYNDMNKPSIHPDFVVMYSYEPSHSLNIENNDHDDDGLIINSDDSQYWPEVIKGKDISNGYTIPAFGVTYGSQYQSYFSDINVSMESPINTEHAIKAQYMIAGQNSEKVEDGKTSIYIGQDLYTIYSNNSYTCTITMVGCAWVQPLMYFCLLNIPMFRGAYLIQKVTHHMEPGTMVTTITGVRMCKTATPIMNKWILSKLNNESGANNPNNGQKLLEAKNQIASIDNDCDYKVFSTNLMTSNGPVFDLSELKATTDLQWLSDAGLKQDYNNLYEAIIATVGAEVGNGANEGELGTKLVVIVMINRLMSNKKNWEKVLAKGQTAVGVRSYAATKGFTNTVKWTEEVLTKGPACVVGMTTEIPTVNEALGLGPVRIRNKGVLTGELSKPVVITMNMVQKIIGYCTTNGYDKRVGNPKALESFNKGTQILWWWEAEYFFHHKGHVFTGGAQGDARTNWKPQETVPNTDKNKLSNTAQGLFDAIQQTVKSSENINIDLKVNIGRNKDEMVITCEPKSNINGKMASVFDVVLNAYYNSFVNLFWMVKESNDVSLDNPHAIIVTTKNSDISSVTNRSVAMVDRSYKTVGTFGTSSSDTKFSLDNSINPLFYRSLYKKYAPLNTNEAINVFNSEVKNYNVSNSDVTNNILEKNKPAPCPANITNGKKSSTDESLYTTVVPSVDGRGINQTLYEKCLKTTVDKFKTLAPNNWNDNFTVIGVRSNLNSNKENITNQYVDICVIIYKENGTVKKFLAPITTVPGKTYLTGINSKTNPNGTAILQENSYYVYAIDYHKNEYRALTQRKGNVTVYRDNNLDDKYNFINPTSGVFGINIHNNSNEDGTKVDDYSAGCQVFKRIKDFYFMMGLAVASGLKQFNYTLIHENKL